MNKSYCVFNCAILLYLFFTSKKHRVIKLIHPNIIIFLNVHVNGITLIGHELAVPCLFAQSRTTFAKSTVVLIGMADGKDSQGGPFNVWTSDFLVCYLSLSNSSLWTFTNTWRSITLTKLLKRIKACCISTQSSVTVVFQNIFWDQRRSASAVFALAETFASQRILALFATLVMTLNWVLYEWLFLQLRRALQ